MAYGGAKKCVWRAELEMILACHGAGRICERFDARISCLLGLIDQIEGRGVRLIRMLPRSSSPKFLTMNVLVWPIMCSKFSRSEVSIG